MRDKPEKPKKKDAVSMLVEQHMSLKDKSLAKKGKALMQESEAGDTGSGKVFEEYGEEKDEKEESESQKSEAASDDS